jgi:hypothetical protein
MLIKNFIEKRPYLIWHVKNFEKISNEAVVEATLNYGDFDDCLDLIKIMGIKNVAEIFRKESNKVRSNYRPEVKNYFELYFKKHA